MRRFRFLALMPLLLGGAAPALAQTGGDLLFISPMGEPFRGTREAPPEVAWFNGTDANHDGSLTGAEMIADADRFFKTLDVDKSGEIDPVEIERYETEIAPEVRTGEVSVSSRDDTTDGPDSFSGGPQGMETYSTRHGAVMFGYFGFPEPVMAADANFNRGVSAREFAQAALQRFKLLDVDGDGILQRAELPPPPRRSSKRRR
jgi:hypothetical protein